VSPGLSKKAHEFSLLLTGPEDGSLILTDQHDRRWRVEEEALVLVEDSSQRLSRLPSRASYWFGWYAFHSDTQVYAGSDKTP
jgi:hypothetical protein